MLNLCRSTIAAVMFLHLLVGTVPGAEPKPPNLVVVLIDDLGWGDFSCFGNRQATTPNIDRLAAEGLCFTQFYVNSPICSPSRCALTTGQYPYRWRISSYLSDHQENQRRGIADWLDPQAPSLARVLRSHGYVTGHFGKWHLGGQRDVEQAPPITAYGFDQSLTNFEGLGPKLLPLTLKPGQTSPGRIWADAERLGGPVTWMQRSQITSGYVDAAVDCMDQASKANRPFYINVWPDDVHSPFWPPVDQWADGKRGLYLSVLESMDRQLGKLFEHIRNRPELNENTLIVVCSDNGPEPGAGRTGRLRGAKSRLYEGGIRSPLIVWGPGHIAEKVRGTRNEVSVLAAFDLVPSLLSVAGINEHAQFAFDGEDLAATLIGQSTASRTQPLYWRRPPDRKTLAPLITQPQPDLAVRDDRWKLLCNYDGSGAELYDLSADPGETKDLAEAETDTVKRLVAEVLKWNASMPQDRGPELGAAAADSAARTDGKTRQGRGNKNVNSPLGPAKQGQPTTNQPRSSPLPNAASTAPNVLMILVDDLKPALGCYGDSIALTPHIDKLAARGMRFELAYCNQAVCAPSRFSLMLGSHPTSTGLYGLGSQLRQRLPNAITLPQHFAKHGYRTESLGKVFHIGHGNQGDPESFSVEHFKDKVIEYANLASTAGGQLTREEAFFTNQQLHRIRELPRGAAFESPDVPDTAYADGRVAAETVKRLAAARSHREATGTPFFIAVGFARPHLPFSAPKKYWDLYDPQQMKLAVTDKPPLGAPPAAGKSNSELSNYLPVPLSGEVDKDLGQQLIHGYYASVSFVDQQIGQVLAAVEAQGLAENTIIVLWGDHGFHLGDHGYWTKHTNYEQANRIPLLIVAPGVTAPGAVTRQLAESVDLYPTLCELAGFEPPTTAQSLDGRSLVPVLRDPTVRVRDHAYHVYPNAKLGRAIRTERYRLVQWQTLNQPNEASQIELYDYETDPHERRNQAADGPEIVEQLQAILATYPPPVR